MADQKAPKGYIVREGYTKKAYVRNAYTRADGVKVKAAKIPATTVPPNIIVDRGAPGKGAKLIPIKDDPRHLSDTGYSFSKTEAERHTALRKAAQKYGHTWTIQHLNAIRNLQHRTNPEIAKKATKDIEYLHSLAKN